MSRSLALSRGARASMSFLAWRVIRIWSGSWKASRVGIDQFADHLLISSVVLVRRSLEEFDAGFTQCHGDFDALLFESQFLRRRQEVFDDLQFAERLICVSYFL